tara:strand:- start:155 stop:520 length:366 start_codon:yes stop_codon:yes gene_type:complete
MNKQSNRFTQVTLAVAAAAVASFATAALLEERFTQERAEVIQACDPIVAEFHQVQQLREEKRDRVERLLGQQEAGNIPFDSQVVDYEYKAWQLQDAALDRRGDDLVREISLLNCGADNQQD